jgi:hypothetical protein
MRFLSDDVPPNGQQPVLAVDAIALMAALGGRTRRRSDFAHAIEEVNNFT